MVVKDTVWESCTIDVGELTLAHLRGLLDRKVACIVVDCFMPDQTCDFVTQAFLQHGDRNAYQQENVATDYLGVPLIRFSREKDEYFRQVHAAKVQLDDFFDSMRIENPAKVVLDQFRRTWPGGAEIASDGGRECFSGIIRAIERSPLHNDHAPRDLKDWELGSIRDQLAWNVLLSEPSPDTGAFQIWNRAWADEDEQYKHESPNLMGYHSDVVSGAPCCHLNPCKGQLVIIHSMLYHEVQKSPKFPPRLTMGGFIGVQGESLPLLFWS